MNDLTIRRLVEAVLASQDALNDPRQHALRALAEGCGLVLQVQTIVEQSGIPQGFDAAEWTCAWLAQPNPALGSERPVVCLATKDGRARVSALLAMAQSGAYG
jgi:uncharacterized protein (DUF2384 family)